MSCGLCKSWQTYDEVGTHHGTTTHRPARQEAGGARDEEGNA
ncbi:hypothetical protein F750_3822 [Streptomyces sp. PAMC 26508]|nr:hypothetical protein F750_3822 [Streptomyces sp. PAMC 26508]